jgi:GNAT superfamily N-acetyltransferase
MATRTATKTARKGRATSAGTRKPASTGKVATKTARTRTEPVKKAATVKKAAAAERMAMKTVPAKKTVTGKPGATATRKTAPMGKPASTAKAARRTAPGTRTAKPTSDRRPAAAAKPARGTGASLAVRRTGASAPAMRWTETLRDGTHVLIRPITRADAALERAFISRLSPQSRRLRFLGQIGEPGDALVRSLVDIDWRRDAAFIALVHHEGAKREVGVSRYSLSPDGRSCECAVTVDDEWHGRGLAVVLMRHLVELARSRGIGTMFSIDSAGNQRMRDLARYLGFACKPDPDEPGQVIHTLELAAK